MLTELMDITSSFSISLALIIEGGASYVEAIVVTQGEPVGQHDPVLRFSVDRYPAFSTLAAYLHLKYQGCGCTRDEIERILSTFNETSIDSDCRVCGLAAGEHDEYVAHRYQGE